MRENNADAHGSRRAPAADALFSCAALAVVFLVLGGVEYFARRREQALGLVFVTQVAKAAGVPVQ
jgi:hypothetical protein